MYQVAVCLLLFTACTAAVYVDTGYPYDVGEFGNQIETDLYTPILPGRDKPIMQTKVFYPSVPGDYAVVYYIPGLFGIIPPVAYNDTLELIATHGYVTIGVFSLLGDGGIALSAQDHLDNIAWLRRNVADLSGAIPDYNLTAIACHSAGCAAPPNMYLMDNDVALAQINLEPVSLTIINQNMSFSVPAVNFGAELANMSCAFPETDFVAYNSKWSCPKVLLEGQNVGHCDFLDEIFYQSCIALEVCEPGGSDRDDYRLFVQGLVAAFATGYVQGNLDQLKYVTDPSQIPWPYLQHEYTEEC